jgi:hypothetical protein
MNRKERYAKMFEILSRVMCSANKIDLETDKDNDKIIVEYGFVFTASEINQIRDIIKEEVLKG